MRPWGEGVVGARTGKVNSLLWSLNPHCVLHLPYSGAALSQLQKRIYRLDSPVQGNDGLGKMLAQINMKMEKSMSASVTK